MGLAEYPEQSKAWTFADPAFGTTLVLRNSRPGPAAIHGIRSLNDAWEIVILSLGPVQGPFDAAAFNLDAIPGPPAGAGHHYPAPENPRFVHYPMGFLAPNETLPVRACPYGSPAVNPSLNLLFFVTDEDDD